MRLTVITELMEEISRVANEHGDPILNFIPKNKEEAARKGMELNEKYYSEAASRLRERGIMVPEQFDINKLQEV